MFVKYYNKIVPSFEAGDFEEHVDTRVAEFVDFPN